MPDETYQLPATQNNGLTKEQRERDYPGASFVEQCRRCRKMFFGARHATTCRKCDQVRRSVR